MWEPVQPLHTATVADLEAAEEYIGNHTSAAAYRLTALTRHHDEDLHEIVLDPDSRTIWWAYRTEPGNQDDSTWTVDQLTPQQAAAQAQPHIGLAQDRMADPASYATAGGVNDLDDDQDLLDEFTQLLRLGLPADPREAAARIKAEREALAAQDALWQRTYAGMVRELTGGQWGGKTKAAKALGISDVQVGRIVTDDDRRRNTLTEQVRELRDGM